MVITFRDHKYNVPQDQAWHNPGYNEFMTLRTRLAGELSVWEMRDIINQLFSLNREPEPQIARDLTR